MSTVFASNNDDDYEVDERTGRPVGEGNTEEPAKSKMSDTMRAKLIKEVQESGADSNYSKGPILGNPIILISIVISVLAIALSSRGYI
jgi:hypothetical protein